MEKDEDLLSELMTKQIKSASETLNSITATYLDKTTKPSISPMKLNSNHFNLSKGWVHKRINTAGFPNQIPEHKNSTDSLMVSVTHSLRTSRISSPLMPPKTGFCQSHFPVFCQKMMMLGNKPDLLRKEIISYNQLLMSFKEKELPDIWPKKTVTAYNPPSNLYNKLNVGLAVKEIRYDMLPKKIMKNVKKRKLKNNLRKFEAPLETERKIETNFETIGVQTRLSFTCRRIY
ncbi:unnamed protein product [Blepharisma stoltei]|uniref:Uncharacterized protein n=1 Tax=Blepharisma stoltei TaxID=1481888 RepID=A0AAU9JHJ2_9CILI|nr:unnamed protein product [Blepharisma stoltei]